MNLAFTEQQAQGWIQNQFGTMQSAFSRAAVALADALAAHQAGNVADLKAALDRAAAHAKAARSAAEAVSTLISLSQSVAALPVVGGMLISFSVSNGESKPLCSDCLVRLPSESHAAAG